jgi:hypothetical protein
MWTIAPTYFIEQFEGKKLTIATNIVKFKPGFDPEAHIQHYEKEWRIICYRDECVWPHMFPNTL